MGAGSGYLEEAVGGHERRVALQADGQEGIHGGLRCLLVGDDDHDDHLILVGDGDRGGDGPGAGPGDDGQIVDAGFVEPDVHVETA